MLVNVSSLFVTQLIDALRRAGRDARDLPSLPASLERLARDARRVDVEVPALLPGPRAFITITKELAADGVAQTTQRT